MFTNILVKGKMKGKIGSMLELYFSKGSENLTET